MPYKEIWVPAEVALKHNGITVYHVYKNNNVGEGARLSWFSLDEDSDDDGNCFDVRVFKCFDPDLSALDNLIAAIDAGELTADGVKED